MPGTLVERVLGRPHARCAARVRLAVATLVGVPLGAGGALLGGLGRALRVLAGLLEGLGRGDVLLGVDARRGVPVALDLGVGLGVGVPGVAVGVPAAEEQDGGGQEA